MPLTPLAAATDGLATLAAPVVPATGGFIPVARLCLAETVPAEEGVGEVIAVRRAGAAVTGARVETTLARGRAAAVFEAAEAEAGGRVDVEVIVLGLGRVAVLPVEVVPVAVDEVGADLPTVRVEALSGALAGTDVDAGVVEPAVLLGEGGTGGLVLRVEVGVGRAEDGPEDVAGGIAGFLVGTNGTRVVLEVPAVVDGLEVVLAGLGGVGLGDTPRISVSAHI